MHGFLFNVLSIFEEALIYRGSSCDTFDVSHQAPVCLYYCRVSPLHARLLE